MDRLFTLKGLCLIASYPENALRSKEEGGATGIVGQPAADTFGVSLPPRRITPVSISRRFPRGSKPGSLRKACLDKFGEKIIW
jgi:hypothetical protein